MSKVQAIILAGGQGSRLRPYTTVVPKPLLPVGSVPVAEIIIKQLAQVNITNIVISVGHLASLIEAYFGNGDQWGVNITYTREKKPLGTAGSIGLVKNLNDEFLVINGDILTDINFKELLRAHKKSKLLATISVKEQVVKSDFGEITVGENNEMLDYSEKPERKRYVSMGVNVLSKKMYTVVEKE